MWLMKPVAGCQFSISAFLLLIASQDESLNPSTLTFLSWRDSLMFWLQPLFPRPGNNE